MPSEDETAQTKRRWPFVEQPDSQFLCLPGELRNRIYKYVLSTTDKLLFIPGANYRVGESKPLQKSYFTTSGTTYELENEFNRLKYICRQMYKETSCLEFTLNTLDFRGAMVENDKRWLPARAFAEFLEECTPSKMSYTSRVELFLHARPLGVETRWWNLDEAPTQLLVEYSASFETIARFCRKHSQATIYYLMDEFTFNRSAITFLEIGLIVSLAVRHKDLCCLVEGDTMDFLTPFAQIWASRRCVEQLRVPNLHIRPVGFYNEESFESEIRTYWFEELTDAEVQQRMDLIKLWKKDGI